MGAFMNVKYVALFLLRVFMTAVVFLVCFRFLILADYPSVMWKVVVGWCCVFWTIDIGNWIKRWENEIYERDKKLKDASMPMYKFDLISRNEFKEKHPDYIAKAVCRWCNVECEASKVKKSDVFFKCDVCDLKEYEENKVEGRLP